MAPVSNDVAAAEANTAAGVVVFAASLPTSNPANTPPLTQYSKQVE